MDISDFNDMLSQKSHRSNVSAGQMSNFSGGSDGSTSIKTGNWPKKRKLKLKGDLERKMFGHWLITPKQFGKQMAQVAKKSRYDQK